MHGGKTRGRDRPSFIVWQMWRQRTTIGCWDDEQTGECLVETLRSQFSNVWSFFLMLTRGRMIILKKCECDFIKSWTYFGSTWTELTILSGFFPTITQSPVSISYRLLKNPKHSKFCAFRGLTLDMARRHNTPSSQHSCLTMFGHLTTDLCRNAA